MRRFLRLLQILRLSLAVIAGPATSVAVAGTVPVTPANFARAETEHYIANVVARGGMGRFAHVRELASPERPLVIRPNRDTLYSTAVFDLDAGPAIIRLPDAGTRYMSLMVISADHFVPLIRHGRGTYRIDRKTVGSRYALVGLRTFVDPTRPDDIDKVHALQDAVEVRQRGGQGRFIPTEWDQASHRRVRDALLALGETLPNLDQAFGKVGQVDPVAHLVGAAMAWGGLPRAEATYLNITPTNNDGETAYRLKVAAVPVDGFWSITVYDRDGRLIPNPSRAYSLNNLSAHHATDGSVTVQFGRCDAAPDNCIPVASGWNYMVRLYRPRREILDGKWVFPTAHPLED